MQKRDMGLWRAFLRCINTIPTPNTVKRWSGVKIAAIALLVFLSILAVARIERDMHTRSGEDSSENNIDHRALLQQPYQEEPKLETDTTTDTSLPYIQTDKASAPDIVAAKDSAPPQVTPPKQEAAPVQENMTPQKPPTLSTLRPMGKKGKDTLTAEEVPANYIERTGQKVFETPKRSPLNERPLAEITLSQYYPLETYFHHNIPDKVPKSPPPQMNTKYDTKMPFKKVLVLLENVKASSKRPMEEFFGPLRIETDFSESVKIPPLVMAALNVPMYSLIVFANYETYFGMAQDMRSYIDEYCRTYGVGILGFTDSSKISEQDLSNEFKIKLQHRMKLNTYKINPELTDIWRVAKPEAVWKEAVPNANSEWTIFLTDHPTYQPLAFSTVAPDWEGTVDGINRAEFGVVVAVRDTGGIDGIRRVIVGNDAEFFLNYIVAMDGIGWLSNGRLALPLERIVQIDVDDMFVGVTAVRTKPKDAEAMVAFNKAMKQYVPNFKLFLGFTGAMVFWGDEDADKGEQMMIDAAQDFIWFNHLYRHELLYITPIDRIAGAMSKNLVFAAEKNLPLIREYMILPHHAGVYPVYPEVFDEWEKTGYVHATSTLEYPYRHPQWGRRGFVHRGVKVLPRQTCRLFTKTIAWDIYGGGKEAMEQSINGGYIFKIFLTTPVMVFMTHMSNYATDQLAQYQFLNVARTITEWTNLKQVAPHPYDTAEEYFRLYPDEIEPLWSDPGRDVNMQEIWRVNKSLPAFPDFLIAGPQKTGTTALLTFLGLHPDLERNNPDPVLFEEVQFFSSTLYDNGIDWYASRFPKKKHDKTVLFEKSANYFSHQKAPRRAKELLPDAKIIIILNNPATRAYSWYQHLKAHNDSITQKYTFHQIISAKEDGEDSDISLAHKRHLHDGMFAMHLSRWLLSYPAKQIYLVDGEKLIKDPITIMNDIQKFLGLSHRIDYKTKLKYDETKGFFCVKETGCLGAGKGRKYDKMDDASAAFLKDYYAKSNEDLKVVLDSIGQPHPMWLQNW